MRASQMAVTTNRSFEDRLQLIRTGSPGTMRCQLSATPGLTGRQAVALSPRAPRRLPVRALLLAILAGAAVMVAGMALAYHLVQTLPADHPAAALLDWHRGVGVGGILLMLLNIFLQSWLVRFGAISAALGVAGQPDLLAEAAPLIWAQMQAPLIADTLARLMALLPS